MGANAQTTVPKYTALTVLPAASMNISAGTGIPVFATTVTRDAAFGGANKVLAEGQLCYLESTDATQYYSGSAWATVGPAANVVQALVATVATITSGSYVTTNLTATITPSSTASRVRITVTGSLGMKSGIDGFLTLFRGTVAGTNLATNASGFAYFYNVAAGVTGWPYAISFVDSPNTVAAQVYTLGAKVTGGSPEMYFARDNTTQVITLEEIR